MDYPTGSRVIIITHTAGTNSQDKLKRKNTVHFKEEPSAVKRNRRFGVVKRDRSRSKSPAREISSREGLAYNKGPTSLKREDTGLQKDSSSQHNTPKKDNKRGKVELPKKHTLTRKISSFAPLLSEPLDKGIDVQAKIEDQKGEETDDGKRNDSENEQSTKPSFYAESTHSSEKIEKQGSHGPPDEIETKVR